MAVCANTALFNVGRPIPESTSEAKPNLLKTDEFNLVMDIKQIPA